MKYFHSIIGNRATSYQSRIVPESRDYPTQGLLVVRTPRHWQDVASPGSNVTVGHQLLEGSDVQ